eukprot:COSAG02_NODE_44331_length_367_cov_0.768657_1_plen_81_part_01
MLIDCAAQRTITRHPTTVRHLPRARRHHHQAPATKRALPPIGESEFAGQILWSLIHNRSVVCLPSQTPESSNILVHVIRPR